MSKEESRFNRFVDASLRVTQVGCLLGVVAVLNPQSEYYDPNEGPQLPSAEQALGSLGRAPDPMSEALQTGTVAASTLTGAAPSIEASPSDAPDPAPEQSEDNGVPVLGPAMKIPDLETKATPAPQPEKPASGPEKPAIPEIAPSKPLYIISDKLGSVRQIDGLHKETVDGVQVLWPPEEGPASDPNLPLRAVYFWNQKNGNNINPDAKGAGFGSDMQDTQYLFAHACPPGHESAQCAGDHFKDFRKGNKIVIATENGTIELTVTMNPVQMDKSVDGVGMSKLLSDYKQKNTVYILSCGYRENGVSNYNWVVQAKITGASTKKYNPTDD